MARPRAADDRIVPTVRPPITCHFGTRVDPARVAADLRAAGLTSARVEVRDDELVLACADPDPRRDDVARGLTALRKRFSPLTPVRAVSLGAPCDGVSILDARARPPEVVALAEVFDPDAGFGPALADLLARLAPYAPEGSSAGAPSVSVAATDDALHAGLADALLTAVGALPDRPARIALSLLVPSRGGGRTWAQPTPAAPAALHALLWVRPGGEVGARQAAIVAAAWSPAAIARLVSLLREDLDLDPRGSAPDVLLDGLVWRVGRRPTLAAPRPAQPAGAVAVDPDRCTSCGLCQKVCPTGYLDAAARPTTDDLSACVTCHECVEVCPVDAIRPLRADDGSTHARALAHRPGWLSRLTGAPGPSVPAPFPPSWLLPRPFTDGAERPRWVLGLAVMTLQEHAAALLCDGEVVGAIEQERLVRVRHAGWHPPGRPGVTAAVDPTLALEEALCRRPVRALLEAQGITLDDVDLIAVNGLHGRYVGAVPFLDADAPIPTIRAGRVVYVPHHLCHAASTWRLGGGHPAWVLTVDGRGDRECAALWRGEGNALTLSHTLLALTDRSVGGVYEGVTQLLGFGSHGQGSVMALASFGDPSAVDVSAFLGDDGALTVAHETGVEDAFAPYRRAPHDTPTRAQQDLAASLQGALEGAMTSFVRRGARGAPVDALAVAGGVALNCRMNLSLRTAFGLPSVFVQPGANDAGTALGAALEAWARFDASPRPPMAHALLGPAFTEEEIERELQRAGLRYRRATDLPEEVAEILASSKVVCWFQGAMEFGPRALGARSVLADPRDPEMHARVNALKQREPWRPFGPSVLAGHEGDWFTDAFDARFMTCTLSVRPEVRDRVPAVVHVDGSARPQVVHPETHPRYHALISAFHRRAGVPMVLNTSFNRRGEPIVCTPRDAVEAFLGLGADVLAIGDFLAEPARAPRPAVDDLALAAAPGGRRLALRLTTSCDLACVHCTVRDLAEATAGAERSHDEALHALAEGRRAGCDELVILRGEAALREDLPALVRRARAMGYRYVQAQTALHALATIPRRERLIAAGVDAFDAVVLAADEALHDRLTRAPGSFRPSMLALQGLARGGRLFQASVPVLRSNLRGLGAVVGMLAKLGVRRVQFNFPRPVELREGVLVDEVPRLAVAAPYLRHALGLARRARIEASTEAFPLCHLPPEARDGGEAAVDWSRHRVDDLHLLHPSLDATRRTQRPDPPPCRACRARARCPRTWGLYLELFGSAELTPLEG